MRKASKKGFLKIETMIQMKFGYDSVKKFKDGRSIAKKDGKFFHITDEGPLNDGRYLEARRYHEGFSAVRDETGWKYIDAFGIVANPEPYKEAYSFKYGVAIVKKNDSDQLSVINKKFESVTDREYSYIGDFSRSGIAMVKYYDNDKARSNLIDLTGKLILPVESKLIKVNKRSGAVTYGFNVNTKNQIVEIFNMVDKRTTSAGQFSDVNLISNILVGRLKGERKCTVIDINGNILSDVGFDFVDPIESDSPKSIRNISLSSLYVAIGKINDGDGIIVFGISRDSEVFHLGRIKND